MDGQKIVRFPDVAVHARVIEYSVLFRVAGPELTFKIFGVSDTEKDRLAVASAFEEAAKLLREGAR